MISLVIKLVIFSTWGAAGVVTWGGPTTGADSSSVASKLADYDEIYSNEYAFAAVLKDRSVVTWGQRTSGGDSSNVQAALKDVVTIFSTLKAFAALLSDRTVVTWGNRITGGDSTNLQSKLKGVDKIYGNGIAFVAVLADGKLLQWGNMKDDPPELTGLKTIYHNRNVFAALLTNGKVVTWGNGVWGGDSSMVASQLKGVDTIFSTSGAFAALLSDRTVVTWGLKGRGADSSSVQSALKGVEKIYSTYFAFAAVLADTTVVTWGDKRYGGFLGKSQSKLIGVRAIFSTAYVFAAVLTDCTLVTWGLRGKGMIGNNKFNSKLMGLDTIYSTAYAFAAVLTDGTVVTWGDAKNGGNPGAVAPRLKGVTRIYSTATAFAAVFDKDPPPTQFRCSQREIPTKPETPVTVPTLGGQCPEEYPYPFALYDTPGDWCCTAKVEIESKTCPGRSRVCSKKLCSQYIPQTPVTVLTQGGQCPEEAPYPYAYHGSPGDFCCAAKVEPESKICPSSGSVCSKKPCSQYVPQTPVTVPMQGGQCSKEVPYPYAGPGSPGDLCCAVKVEPESKYCSGLAGSCPERPCSQYPQIPVTVPTQGGQCPEDYPYPYAYSGRSGDFYCNGCPGEKCCAVKVEPESTSCPGASTSCSEQPCSQYKPQTPVTVPIQGGQCPEEAPYPFAYRRQGDYCCAVKVEPESRSCPGAVTICSEHPCSQYKPGGHCPEDAPYPYANHSLADRCCAVKVLAESVVVLVLIRFVAKKPCSQFKPVDEMVGTLGAEFDNVDFTSPRETPTVSSRESFLLPIVISLAILCVGILLFGILLFIYMKRTMKNSAEEVKPDVKVSLTKTSNKEHCFSEGAEDDYLLSVQCPEEAPYKYAYRSSEDHCGSVKVKPKSSDCPGAGAKPGGGVQATGL